jgi:hypothetical protein
LACKVLRNTAFPETLNKTNLFDNQMTLLTDLQYFPPVIFFYRLSEAKHCIFDEYEEYQKMSFRNRCTVAGGNGPINMSIPLIGGRSQRTLMKDVRVQNEVKWQANHWKTIMSCYNKSPWFDHYAHELQKLYSTPFVFLKDWNLACMSWITDKMAIKTSISLSTENEVWNDKNEVEDFRGHLMPATINKLYPQQNRYPQVFEDRVGFIPNLSILDYLFCAGNKL